MKRNVIHMLLLVLLLVSARMATAGTYLSVDFYPVTEEAYNGETPLNSVLRAPLTSIISSSKCFGGLVESDKGDKPCTPEWSSFSKMCKQQIKKVVLQTKNEDEGSPKVAIARMNQSGGAAMIVRSYFGGSGGGRDNWRIFILKWKKEDDARCPFDPFMAGVEVGPGGRVWAETYCKKNESTNACAERIFYPKGKAARLEFGEMGAQLSTIPVGAKLPEDDITKYW